MLYEMICLAPRCFSEYTLSTEVMLFNNIDSPLRDSPIGYGLEVTAGYSLCCDEINKYKVIELCGGKVIERLLVSYEPIDLSKGWWTSNQRVIVLQSKFYDLNKADVIRNVNGLMSCEDVIEKKEMNVDLPVNLYQNFLGNILTNINAKNKILSEKLAYAIPATDIELVNFAYKYNFNWQNYFLKNDVSNCEQLCGGLRTIPEIDIANFLETDTKLNVFGHNVNKTSVTSDICQREIDSVNTLFDPAESTFISSVEYSWNLLELLYVLNNSHYTDIKISYNLRTDNIPKIYASSRYIGKELQKPNIDLARLFQTWVNEIIRSVCIPVETATLIKTWSEEVFIELVHFDCVRRYYFDLVPFVVGTISLY